MDRRRLLSPTGTTLSRLEKTIYQYLKKNQFQLKDKKLLVAVSGGVDSIVLLYVLLSLKSRLDIELVCCHVNHGIRGRDSDRDSEFVSSICHSLKIKNVTKKLVGLGSSASENKLREERYKCLFETKKKLKADFVVTAHHHDDLLETRIMRLIQGTGGHGLKAMSALSPEGLLRPFLCIKRNEIEDYAREKDIAWCTDATNADTEKLRNWIRHHWLGALKRDHPEYLQPLHNSLERLVMMNDLLGGQTGETKIGEIFDRRFLSEEKKHSFSNDNRVYNYLRQFAKKRVTNALVKEFKKQLLNPRKTFTFRLGGVNWRVNQNEVSPT